jgi:uncharacterized protein (DUF1810 family)
MTDYGLDRFVRAQDRVYDAVRAELGAGRKRTHWMWFVFPQLDGLGSSPTAREYAIRSLDEAVAYLAHPVLGARLRECAGLVAASGRSLAEMFGFPDDLKLRSSMTLFRRAAPDEPVFQTVLDRHFGGEPDEKTDNLLRGRSVS